MTKQRGMQYLRAPEEEEERWLEREAVSQPVSQKVSERGSLSPPTNGIWGQFKLDRVIQGAWSMADTERYSPGRRCSFLAHSLVHSLPITDVADVAAGHC